MLFLCGHCGEAETLRASRLQRPNEIEGEYEMVPSIREQKARIRSCSLMNECPLQLLRPRRESRRQMCSNLPLQASELPSPYPKATTQSKDDFVP